MRVCTGTNDCRRVRCRSRGRVRVRVRVRVRARCRGGGRYAAAGGLRHLLHGLTSVGVVAASSSNAVDLEAYRRSVADLQAKFEAATTASTAARAEVQRLEARLAGLKKEQRRLERCKAVAKEESKVNELVWEINELVEEVDEISGAHAHASAALQEATNTVSLCKQDCLRSQP